MLRRLRTFKLLQRSHFHVAHPLAAVALICLQRGPTILRQVDENTVPAESDREVGKIMNASKSLYRLAAALAPILAGAFLWWTPARSLAADNSLLGGRITTSDKQAASGIPIRAHRDDTNITVSVYTNSRGEYSFPAWSDLSPGSYSVAIVLPDFEPVNREGVMLTAEKTVRLDLTLQRRQPSLVDATAAEIAMAEPGTDDQRFLLTQCDNCHTLQWALRKPHTKDEWVKIVRRMAGEIVRR